MFLNKKLLSVTALVLGLPLAANADLVTHNNTDQPSTVFITSAMMHVCSSSLSPPAITQPHSTLPKDWGFVGLACLGSPGGQCTANIYMTDHCGNDSDVIAVATLDTNSHTIKSIDPRSAKYAVTFNNDPSTGTASLFIDPKSK